MEKDAHVGALFKWPVMLYLIAASRIIFLLLAFFVIQTIMIPPGVVTAPATGSRARDD